LLIIPALVGAGAGNDKITIVTNFVRHLYRIFKYLVLGGAGYVRCMALAVKTVEVIQSSPISGSTDTKPIEFKTKMKLLVRIAYGALTFFLLNSIYTTVTAGTAWYSRFREFCSI